MSERGRRKWWVLGCGGLLLAIVLLAATLAGLTWRSIRKADRRDTVLVQEPIVAAETHADAPGDVAALNILMELDSCELYLEPGEPGEPLSVEAHYDDGDYDLEQTMKEGDPRSYHLRFVTTSSRLITGIKQGISGGQPQLRIRLPRDVPIDLTLVQRNGGAVVDLGGLHLTQATFDTQGALLKVDADEPLQGELGNITVLGGRGGLFLESLDRMQPDHIDVDFRMGQIHLDFRGAWAADTTVDLSMSLTDAIVRLPRDVGVEGLSSTVEAPAAATELPRPTLFFSVEPGKRTTVRVFD